MTNETKRRIQFYTDALPGMKARVFSALMILGIAMVTAVMSTYAWVTLSYAPEVTNLTTTLSANGALEIALSKADGTEPDEFDIDESVGFSTDIVAKNLTWGNLVNLSDPSYGIENLALRPAQLNTAALLTNPLQGATYGADGRASELNTNYAYAVYNGSQFLTSNNTYGVRSIASYTAQVSDEDQAKQQRKIDDINSAHTAVNQAWNKVPNTFSAMGTMISKYAQDKLDDTNTNLAPYIGNMIPLYNAVRTAMEAQMDAYVALANFQNYIFAQNNETNYVPITWEEIAANKAQYNVNDKDSVSSNKIISLVGLTQFISDYNTIVSDIGYLNQYNTDYKDNGTAYYWGSGGVNGHQLNNIVANLIQYDSMTIDLKGDGKEVAVTALSSDNASDLLAANNKSRNVYTYKGIAIRFEQLAVDESYRLNGRAACTIKVTKILTITVNGKAYTKASGPCYYSLQQAKVTGEATLAANDSIAEDSYGLVVDLWLRCNAEKTCLTLEGATATDEQGIIMAYDGVNRVWGSTGEANLTTDSTTQGGGSCYIYYADTPEDQARSLDLLDSMKVAFVDSEGNLLATAEMDTTNYFAAYGRITVPLVLETNTQTTYSYFDDMNQEIIGRAITTLYLDHPQRIMAIVYLDGTQLKNTNVLADAEIQGQLNIQFGSSENISTIGDNDLLVATRSVNASLSKTEMDFDNAVTDDDLTTDAVVSVEGTQPSTMTAFFLREINAFQGSREGTMTFEKQADGTWTSSYRFNAPGTYYLRHIRLDGVEYALKVPQKVVISGFALKSVSWGEGIQNNVQISTSEDSYTESVSVEFASNDRSRMPKTVSARFVRSDGNVTNTALSYSSASGKWTGKAVFTTSDTYTLSYLFFDKNYYDLESRGMAKTLSLNLGLYVIVENGEQSLQNQYEAGETYIKDLRARILDNSGKEMEDIDHAVLFYSNGGSGTGTVNTDLTWNEAEGCYTGELTFTRAGRYRFSSVTLGGGGTITRCTNPPIYSIISPNPPVFDTARSVNTYYGATQFAPLTYDAKIDNIYINDGEAATVQAVVYNKNAAVQSGNEVLQSGYYLLSSENGEVYYTGESWCINLPSYTTQLDAEGIPLSGAKYTQEGTWQLCALLVSECYDSNSDYRYTEKPEGGKGPLIWVGNDSDSSYYASESGWTSDATINFSKLSTNVSCTIKVNMVSGTTALGSSSDDFMTRYPVSGIGMYVLLTNDSGEVIPSKKVNDVTLNVSYTPPASSAAYGYKVLSGAAKSYVIHLNAQDAEDGHRTVSEVNGSSDADWQYVGEYKVSNLVVTMGSNTLTYTPSSDIGVPQQYTVTTAGPSSDNIELLDDNINQKYTVLGRVGNLGTGAVNGTFLQAQDPGVTAKVTLTTEDGSDTQYVVLDDVTMQLVLTYQNGKSAPNGGYSWSGTSQYETVTINMTNSSGTYITSASPLLAGAYAAQLEATVGGTTTTKNLKNVNVYSKTPTVKIKAVSPTTSIQMNPDLTSYVWNNVEDGLIQVQNYHTDYVANVYAGVSRETPTNSDGEAIAGADDLVKYSLPEVTLEISNLGSNYDSADVSIGNAANGSKSNKFSFGGTTATEKVGAIDRGSFSTADGGEGCSAGSVKVEYDIYYPAGEQTFNRINAVKDNVTYYVALTDPITIRENNSAPPSIRFAASPAGYSTPAEQTASEDGASFAFTLPSTIGIQQDTISVPMEGAEWSVSGTPATQKICYVVYENEPTLKDSGTRGSCSSKYSYWIYQMTYTYYKFTKITTQYTLTTGTNNYSIQKGVTGWKIGDTVYQPGQTITVDGVLTVEPVIGEIPGTRIFLNSQTQTGMKERIQITSDGTEPKTVTADSDNYSKNQNNTKAAVMNKEDANKPSAYEWGNPNNKKEVITTQDYYTDPTWRID